MSKFKTIIGGIGTLAMVCGGVVGLMIQPVDAATNLGPAAEDQFVDDPVTIVRINPNWNTVAIEYNGTGDFLGNRMALINIMWEDPYDVGRLDEFGELRDQQPDWANPYMYFKVPTWSMVGTPGMTWRFDGPGEVKGELLENKMMKLYYSIGAMVGAEMVYQSGVIDYSTCARGDGSIPEGVECRAVKYEDGNAVYEPFFLDGEKPEWAALETGSYNPEEVYTEEIEEGKIAREEAERLEREEMERLEKEAQEEQERLEREERERLEQEERERIEQEEQERLEREERERIEREEQERLGREKQIEEERQLQEDEGETTEMADEKIGENERSVNTEVTKEVTKIEEYKTVIEMVKNEGNEQKIVQEVQEEQGDEQEVKNDGEENKQISNEIVEVPELGEVEGRDVSDWTGIAVAVLTGAVVGAGGFWLVLHLLWKKKQEDEE